MAVSNGLASLGDGFLQGFQVADQAVGRRQEATQREEALKQQQQNADRNYSLSSAQFDYSKQNTDRDFQRQLDRDKTTDAVTQQELALRKQGLGLQGAELGLRSQQIGAQIADQKWKQAYTERQARLQDEMPLVQAVYSNYKQTGTLDPTLVGKISKDNPYNPIRFVGAD